MRVGIVGAGICGLAAARELERAGYHPTVFERNPCVGGRVATYRDEGFVWDTGATSFAPRGKAIESVMLTELDTKGLVKLEKPIYLHEGLRVRPGHQTGSDRYTYVDGNVTFALRLAAGLDVRLGTPVEAIEAVRNGYRLAGEDFDAVIVAAPVPQSAMLLWSLGENRPLANVHYRSCLSVLLGYHSAPPPTHYHALLEQQQIHPLTWLSLESVKCSGRAPDGGSTMTAQLSAAYSHDHYEAKDAELINHVAAYVAWLYGPEFGSPYRSHVVRWKYARPENFATFEHVNRPGSRVLVASDGLFGGHVEDAFEIGTRAAGLLVEEI